MRCEYIQEKLYKYQQKTPGVTTGVGYILYKYRISRIGIAEYIEDRMKNIYRKTSGN